VAINFAKLGGGNAVDTILHPREIFAALPNKDGKYQYPRDVQAEVWNQWYARRDEKDIVLRMNTGSGKTVVALLILKSCLNENKGPAVYVAPDSYLAKQIIKEGKQLGIETVDDPDSIRFKRGKAILVTNIWKLINGQSVFGTSETGIKVTIGSIIIDDAHACLETTEGQFTMTADGLFRERLLQLFQEDLRLQSEAKLAEIIAQQSNSQMLIPYWAWIDKQSQVVSLLTDVETCRRTPARHDEFTNETYSSVRFNYPLIKESLNLCRCVITGTVVEISPRIIPIDVIPCFGNASRRIVMSATLADDSILVSHFNFSPESITKSITPTVANDIGDRMILIPQELNAEFEDDALKEFFKGLAATRNVVVIVPSKYRSAYWQDVAAMTLKADSLEEGIEKMKSSHVGLVVLINKYDGIDLPKKTCEVLVVDGLPDVRREIDKIEESVLYGTEQILSQRIQRIEQGMGRGVRSNDDYCLVFLIGKTLTNFLYKAGAAKKFSAATRAQLALSEQLSDELHGKQIFALKEVSESFLKRDQEWIKVSRGAMANLKYEPINSINPVAVKQRQAFESARRNNLSEAVRLLNEASNGLTEPKMRGWLKQQLAEYTHFINPSESQIILKSAINENPRIIRPISGIDYQRIDPSTKSQSIQCAEFIKSNFANGNELILEANSYTSQLIFQPDTSEVFEETLKELGWLLGFKAQRPEKEFGQGPDVLWEVGDKTYFVIECKNGVTSDNPINKHDCNQLNGSIVWFSGKYGAEFKCVPMMIHKNTEYEHAASLDEKVGIIDKNKLDDLRFAIRKCTSSIAAGTWGDTTAIGIILKDNGLTREGIQKLLIKPRRARKS